MKDNLAVAVDSVLPGGQEVVDVGLVDRVAAKLRLDAGDIADQAARAIARPDVFDRHAGHPFGKLYRFPYSELARRHVGDVAALDAAAFALAASKHGQPAVLVGFGAPRATL